MTANPVSFDACLRRFRNADFAGSLEYLEILEARGFDTVKAAKDAAALGGLLHFQLGQFEEAIAAFSLVVFSSEGLFPDIRTDEEIAFVMAMSLLGASNATRKDTLALLTNYASSPCKAFLDSDSFVPLRLIGHELERCNFGAALEILKGLAHVPHIDRIVNEFALKLLAQMLPCFASLKLSEIQAELHMGHDDVLHALKHLITTVPELSHYRVNMQTGEVRQTMTSDQDKLNWAQAQTNRALDEAVAQLKLFLLRLMIGENSVAVD